MQDIHTLQIVEAAYNLSATSYAALVGIARAFAAALPRGPVAVAWFDANAQLDPHAVCFERADQDDMARFFDWQTSVALPDRQLALSLAPQAVQRAAEATASQQYPRCIMANTGDGGGLHIAFGHPDQEDWRSGRIQQFHDIALQIAAAWRVRTALNLGAPRTAAAEPPREQLQRIVLNATRRTCPGLPLWPLLIAGRWSVIESFTTGGVRYVVAGENPATTASLRALSARELGVLEHALAGRSGKWIAFEMQLSESVVTRTLRNALRRLGVVDTAALAGLRNARFEPLVGVATGDALAVARLAPAAVSRASLSDAELAVVEGILGGKRNAAIAHERGTSPRTVAHQIASTYHKLGVSSRRELIALLT